MSNIHVARWQFADCRQRLKTGRRQVEQCDGVSAVSIADRAIGNFHIEPKKAFPVYNRTEAISRCCRAKPLAWTKSPSFACRRMELELLTLASHTIELLPLSPSRRWGERSRIRLVGLAQFDFRHSRMIANIGVHSKGKALSPGSAAAAIRRWQAGDMCDPRGGTTARPYSLGTVRARDGHESAARRSAPCDSGSFKESGP